MVHFNPRSPCGERRRYTIVNRYSLTVNFNPRSPCGERQMGTVCSSSAAYFNPRSPCGERLSIVITIKNYIMQFQSTLPVRGATNSLIFSFNSLFSISIHAPRAGSDGVHFGRLQRNKNFNPRSPCGERLFPLVIIPFNDCISIHAPRAGSDEDDANIKIVRAEISIHAPRAGSDNKMR